MPVTVKEFTQKDWIRPSINTYREQGDFSLLNAMIPTPNGRGLQLAPDFTSYVAFPTGFTQVRGVFFDDANSRVVFIGKDTNPHLSTVYYSSSWVASSINNIEATTISDLGGLHGRNFVYWGGDLYVIGSDGDVWAGSDYTAALANFYATGDAQLLATYGDRIYMAATDGTIYRLNDADNAFESHYAVVGDLDIVYLTGYRQYLYAIARDPAGTLFILRIDAKDSATNQMHIVAQLPNIGTLPTRGNPFTQQGNHLYFSPGCQITPENALQIPVYSFQLTTSSYIKHEATIDLDSLSDIVTLVPWRDNLFIARLVSSGAASEHALKVLMKEGAATGIPVTADARSSFQPTIWNAGDHLVLTANAATTEGYHRAGQNTGFQNGRIITSFLDFGHPGRQKRLEALTVLTSAYPSSTTTVTIKYRTDDSSTWVTATAEANNRVVTITGLDVDFYIIQIRAEIATTTDQRIAVEAISATYTAPE